MRLVCPNCGAQYEVDDALVPAGGRDVQCSNCGHTWFQLGPGEAEPEEITEKAAEAEGISEEAEAETGVAEEPAAEAEAEEEAPAPRRTTLDESVADVLREEAERERRAREAEAQGSAWEEQPDLGLDEAMPAPGRQRAEPQEQVARLRGIEPERPEAEAGPRRDLLPDIEEINYTLRSTSERKRATAAPSVEVEEAAPARGGFGLGFSLAIVLAALALAAYMLAPQIADQIPQLEPILNGYVAAVDQLRIGLEVVTNILVEKITSLTT